MKFLSIITKSKTRKRLFILFFSNPEKKYYLHEIARLIECPAQNIRRDLLPFVKDEVFKMERVGNLTFYYLNQDYPLYEELKSIITKTVGIEALFKGVLKNISNIQAAFIFGSFADGKNRKDSDLDIAVLGFKEVSFKEQIGLTNELSHLFSKNVDLSVLNKANPLLLFEASKKPILLYGSREEFLKFKLYAFNAYNDYAPYFAMEKNLNKKIISAYAN